MRALLVVALVACSKGHARESVADGEACESILDCWKQSSCVHGKCRARGGSGAFCRVPGDCAGDFDCEGEKCVGPEVKAARLATYEAQRQRDMLAQAAVKPPATPEAPITDEPVNSIDGSAGSSKPPAFPKPAREGDPIRIVRVTSASPAFATCATDEELLSGGCEAAAGSPGALEASYPSGPSKTSTVGARWNCRSNGTQIVHAYALCKKL